MKNKPIHFYIFFGLLITLVVTTSLLLWGSFQDTNNVEANFVKDTSNVWVYNCELPEQKPESMLLTCADGGIRIEQIIWSTWSSMDAFGYGTYLENNCDPDCSEGEYESIKVTLNLKDLIQHKGKLFFKTLRVATHQGQNQIQKQITSKWDIFEFGQMMNM